MFVVIMPIFYEHVGRGRTTTTASDIDLALASISELGSWEHDDCWSCFYVSVSHPCLLSRVRLKQKAYYPWIEGYPYSRRNMT